jgi:hypothetical protein
MTLDGAMLLRDLQHAIDMLRAAGCPWTAPVTSVAGINVEWTEKPTLDSEQP